MKLLLILSIFVLSSCSTVRYYLDDTKLQALQDDLSAIKTHAKARLETKLETVEKKIDEARELEGAALVRKVAEVKAKIEALRDEQQ